MKVQTNIPLSDAEDLEILASHRHQSLAEMVRQCLYRELITSADELRGAKAAEDALARTPVPR
jgi:hypothetical protein